MHQNTDDKCRLCKKKSETIVHILCSCMKLAEVKVTVENNHITNIHTPKNEIQNEQTKVLWN